MSSSFLITGSLLDVDVDWLMLGQLELGVKTIRQERCAFSITEDHLSQRGVGFDHDAGTIVPCSVRVNPHNSQEGEKRVDHSLPSRLLGLMAAASNLVTLACCTWDPYSGDSSPRGSPWGENRFACSRSHGAAFVPYTCGWNLGS